MHVFLIVSLLSSSLNLQESPKGSDLQDPIFDDFFNLTFTYRKNADISRPYGVFIDKHTEEPIDFTKIEYQTNGQNEAEGGLSNKTKDIAWLVSHCDTESRREDYVQGLTLSSFFFFKKKTKMEKVAILIVAACCMNI